jgi:putative endonuclease
MSTRDIGLTGEKKGLSYLKKRGYKVIERNFRTVFGEIDIIARDGGTLCFIEVKFRGSDRFGRPAEAVNRAKQARIVKSALQYIKENNIEKGSFRFDALLFGPGENEAELIKDAFSSSGRYTL